MSHGEAMILVMGTAEDQHAAAIYNKIIARGNRVAYFDPRLYPKDMTITFDSALPMAGTIRYRDGESAVDLSLVNSVYCRHWDDMLVNASAMGAMPDARLPLQGEVLWGKRAWAAEYLLQIAHFLSPLPTPSAEAICHPQASTRPP